MYDGFMATASPRFENTAPAPLRNLWGADTDGVIYAMSDAEFVAWVAINPPPDMSEPDWRRRQRDRQLAAVEAARRSGRGLLRALRPVALAAVAEAVAHGSDRKFMVRYTNTTVREFFNLMVAAHAAIAAALREASEAAASLANVSGVAVAAAARDASAAVASRLHGLIHQSLTARIAQVGRGASI